MREKGREREMGRGSERGERYWNCVLNVLYACYLLAPTIVHNYRCALHVHRFSHCTRMYLIHKYIYMHTLR